MAYEPTDWEKKFLELYRKSGNVSLSASGCGINRSTVYERRKAHPDFAQRMDEVREEAIEVLEDAAWKRAKKSSDTLLIFLLKSLKPDMYRETQRHELTGANGGAIEHSLTIEQAVELLKSMNATKPN